MHFLRLSFISLTFLAVILVVFNPLASNFKALAVFNKQPKMEPYAANQIIVRYKMGQSPEELKAIVGQRQKQSASILGMLIIFFDNLKSKLAGKELPENKLARLESADQQAGIIESRLIFESDDPSLQNFYLLEGNGALSVTEMVKLYQNLPEVEFAEPNYTYSIMEAK